MVVEYSMVNQVAGHFNDRSELSQKVVENVKSKMFTLSYRDYTNMFVNYTKFI